MKKKKNKPTPPVSKTAFGIQDEKPTHNLKKKTQKK